MFDLSHQKRSMPQGDKDTTEAEMLVLPYFVGFVVVVNNQSVCLD